MSTSNYSSNLGGGGSGSTTFTGLTDTPSNFSGSGGKGVRVNSGASALEFYTLSAGGGGTTISGNPLSADEQAFTATQGQTVFSLSPDVDVNNAMVFINGARALESDYTLTASQLTLDEGATVNDEVVVIGWNGTISYVSTTNYITGGSFDINEQNFTATAGQTVFNLSPTVDTSNTLVFLNGARLKSTDYTLTTSQVTLLSAVNLSDEISVIDHTGTLTSTSTVTAIQASGFSKSIISSNTNLIGDNHYFVNTSGGVVVGTLPATPSQWTEIKFTDNNSSFGTNAFIIGRNGETIMSLSQDLSATTNNASFSLVYNGSDWRISH